MNLKLTALLPAAALAAAALLPDAPADAAAPTAALEAHEYAIDDVHSTVLFRVEHLGIGRVWGRFNEIAGTIVHDPDDPAASSLDVTVQADSVDTDSADRDKHLRNADFLSAKEFPEITFESKSVAKRGDGLAVTGDLTLHGVTKEVTADVTHVGRGDDPWGNVRVGFEARFTIDRTDYGMTYMSDGGIGNDVEMIVAVEAVREK